MAQSKWTFSLLKAGHRTFITSVNAETGGQARDMIESMYSGYSASQLFCQPLDGTMEQNSNEKESPVYTSTPSSTSSYTWANFFRDLFSSSKPAPAPEPQLSSHDLSLMKQMLARFEEEQEQARQDANLAEVTALVRQYFPLVK